MCPFHFEISSFSDSFRVNGSLGIAGTVWNQSVLRVLRGMCHRPGLRWRDFYQPEGQWWSFPLFRLLRASCYFFVMLGVGGCACWRMVFTRSPYHVCSLRIQWPNCWLNLTIISVAETLARETAKFRPLFSKDTSASLRVLNDKLITQLFVNISCRKNTSYFSRKCFSNLRCLWYLVVLKTPWVEDLTLSSASAASSAERPDIMCC